MSNTNNLTDYVLMPGPDYQDMCNAIREKTGITGDIISSQIGNIIRSIQGSVVLPTHTVNFYNDTTLLQSYANVVYGSTVTYTGETPTKAGTDTVSYTFIGFEPSGARITGDTNCYAQFVENVIEPDEPEVTYGWVPMAADGVSYMGETVTVAGAFVVPVLWEFVLSETNQYRATIDGTEYLFSLSEDSDYTDIGEIITLYREGNTIAVNRYMDYPSSTTMALKLESYAAVSAEEEPTIGEWVSFCADGVTWMGEQVTEAKINTKPVIITDVVLSETNQYRLTVDGTEYICVRNEENYGASISCDGCPVIINYDESLGGWYFADDDSDTRFSGTLKVESWTGSEPYVPETPEAPDEPETTGEWVFFCANDKTWTGEALGRIIAGSQSRFGDHYREDVRLSPTNEYRMTIDGVEYLCSMNDNGEIGSSSMPAYTIKKVLSDDSIIYTVLTGTNLSRLNSFKLESWIPFTSEEPEIGEWVLYDTNGEKWVGETVDSDDCFSNTRIVISPTNQYRVTLDGVSQIVGNLNISNDDVAPFNGGEFYGEFGDTCVMFNDGDSHVFKVESWVGEEPYVPEGEGNVPTASYQAFTTDGTWTGESVTTAYAPTTNIDRTLYYRESDIKYVGSTSLPIDNNTVVLLTVDGVSYECHAALTRDTKNIWYFASDGCPVALGGGYNVGDNNWWLAFASAGTYTVKVEVKI